MLNSNSYLDSKDFVRVDLLCQHHLAKGALAEHLEEAELLEGGLVGAGLLLHHLRQARDGRLAVLPFISSLLHASPLLLHASFDLGVHFNLRGQVELTKMSEKHFSKSTKTIIGSKCFTWASI